MRLRSSISSSLLFVLAALVVFAGTEKTWAQDLVIRASVVYTMDGDPLRPGAVLIKDGKVVSVSRSITAPEGSRVIDLGDGALMPGMINGYSEFGIASGGSESTDEITPDFKVLSSIDFEDRAFKQAVREGSTSVCIFPGRNNIVGGRTAVVKTAGDELARRVVQENGGMTISITRDAVSGNRRVSPDTIYMRIPTDRMGLIYVLRKTLDEAVRKRPPKMADLNEALEGKIPIYTVGQAYDEVLTAMRIGEEFSYKTIVVSAQEAYKAAKELAASQTPVIISPLTSGESAGGGGGRRGGGGGLAKWNRAGVLHAAGVKFALSGGSMLEQARFAVRCGLPEEAALAAITRTPAEILGISDRVGAIVAGRDADFVALSGDPLGLTTKINWVMVDGQIQYEEKE